MTAVAVEAEGGAVPFRGTVEVPSGWVPPTNVSGRMTMTPRDPAAHVGSGFLPNINAMLEVGSLDGDGLDLGHFVLASGPLPTGPSNDRFEALTVSEAGGAVIAQLIGRCSAQGVTLTVVCSASLESWASVAPAFDAVVASMTITESER